MKRRTRRQHKKGYRGSHRRGPKPHPRRRTYKRQRGGQSATQGSTEPPAGALVYGPPPGEYKMDDPDAVPRVA